MGIYYSTVDGVVLTFSKIHKNGVFDEIDFRFERPNAKGGFDFAEGKLPNNMFCKTYGFSEDELFDLENYIKNNAFLIWELTRESA